MNDNTPTLRGLLEHPKVRGLVSREEMDRIVESFGESGQLSKEPVYIRIISGLGAWFAALFFILFLGVSHILESAFLAIIFGMIFLVIAIFIAREKRAAFLRQFSLALAFSGNILILFGSANSFGIHGLSILVITHAIICIVVYPLYASDIYRFLAPTALVALITAWIIEEEVFVLMHALIAAEMFLAGILLLGRKRPPLLTPLIYSAASMLPATLLLMNFTQADIWRTRFHEPLWPSSLLLACGLIYIYFHLAGGLKRIREPWLILAILSTILLGIFTTPGILVAIGLLVLGYGFGDRILTGLSYLFLPCFLVVFYYALNINLAYKSWVVAGSGVLLLVVRWIVGRLRPEEVAA